MAGLLIGQRVHHRLAELDVFVRRDGAERLHVERVSQGLIAPQHLDLDLLADVIVEHVLEGEEFRHGFAVDRNEDVAGREDPVCGRARLHLVDHEHAGELGECGAHPRLCFFPMTEPSVKDSRGSEAQNPDNLVCRAVRAIKAEVPHIGLMTDAALDPYTTHGHDGVMAGEEILNDATVHLLAAQSLNQARAGADIISPSDMMDGRVGAIRAALDGEGFEHVQIMSYAAKYASAFYGPFRDAIGTKAVLVGDKRTYQMDPANSDEAMREVAADIEEGADMVMVKPGMPYLDIIRRVKDTFEVPTFAYQVSGEYAMIMAAAQNGWIDVDRAMMESLVAFKRAGCDGVLTYFALTVAKRLKARG